MTLFEQSTSEGGRMGLIPRAGKAVRDRWADAALEFGGDDIRVSEALAEAALRVATAENARLRHELVGAVDALRDVYYMLSRRSCKSVEPDGCPVCVARAILNIHEGEW